MAVHVRERTIEEFEEKLATMSTALNKLIYLESALKQGGLNFEIKRFLWGELASLYRERKMFEKAAKALSHKASMEVSAQGRIEGYTDAAEVYSLMGKVDLADQMFNLASRDATREHKQKVLLARKNIYFMNARDLEKKGKRAGAVKFYEKLLKMKLDSLEHLEVKDTLVKIYTSLGMFREARLVEGL